MSADTARLTIDLDAVAANHALLRGMAAGAETAPVVKADGYGMDAARVARRLWAEGARTFYVARAAEGVALRAGLGERPASILVFDGALPTTAAVLRDHRLTPVLNSPAQVATWRGLQADPPACALHVDTGMNRLGLTLDEAAALSSDAALPGLGLTLVISHLACAAQPDHPMNALQLDRFTAIRARFPSARASLASSAGVFLGGAYHFDQVRPGISLYGGGPHDRCDDRLAPVARLEAPVLQLRDIGPGDSVGYGADFVADRPMRLAILGVGYADGYLRASSPRGGVWLAGQRRPILGRISMDLIGVDVTGGAAVREGDLAELLGHNLALDDAAAAANASSYEFLVRMGRRAERTWLGEA